MKRLIVSTLLWANLTNRNVWIAILSTVAFGAIGFADDYLKVVKKQNLGLRGRSKLYFQLSRADAHTLAGDFEPELAAHDLANLARHTAAARLCLNGEPSRPFTLHTDPLP